MTWSTLRDSYEEPANTSYSDLQEPLAHKYRPEELNDFKGQEDIIALLEKMIEKKSAMNMIFYGPSGTGKTTLAKIISKQLGYHYEYLNAIKSSKAEVSELSTRAKKHFELTGKKTLLFFDEIHRFNKLQQDSFLQDLETGNIILIGATTENPYYSLNNALISRCLLFEFKQLNQQEILTILSRIAELEKIIISEENLNYIAGVVEGDARYAINLLEMIQKTSLENITLPELKTLLGNKKSYDRTQDKYDTISAMIKSIRGSDPDAAIYRLAKMLVGGEDPRYIARRLTILAAEDIGLADPQALTICGAAMQAVAEIGMPEARIILSEAAIYLATAPKSNSAYLAINQAIDHINNSKIQEVPKHLTKLGKADYKYPHDYPNHYIPQSYLNQKISFYKPAKNKRESFLQDQRKKIKGE